MLHKFLQNSYQHLYTTRFCSAQTGKRVHTTKMSYSVCTTKMSYSVVGDFCLLCDFCTDAKLVAPAAGASVDRTK